MSTSVPTFPATIEGLREVYCDPLILAVHVDEGALKGLTAEVDWRLAGQLTQWLKNGRFEHDAPILAPKSPFLPAGRLLFWRVGSVTPQDLSHAVNDLGKGHAGICPADFGFDNREVADCFGESVTIFNPASPR